MYCEETAYKNCDIEDLWIFDKLILSKKLGYNCGPVGVDVPKAGYYIVRPCVNLLGMGIGAKLLFIESSTDHLTAGHFWCEVFTGDHLSFDYVNSTQKLCVRGIKEKGDFSNFKYWVKIENKELDIPDFIKEIMSKYKYVNIEAIDGNIIEVHLRNNPDFADHNSDIAIPVFKGEVLSIPNGFRYIESEDANRVGFLILDKK